MTVRQVQDLLHYLGYPLTPDGAWGPESTAALKKFQGHCVGLPIDGNPDDAETQKALKAAVYDDMFCPTGSGTNDPSTNTGTFWADIPNFKKQEFACQCGGRYCNGFPAEPKEAMVRLAQAARTHFGRPATIVSGVRCQQHNANVGGVYNSQHMDGEACDLRVEGISADKLLAFLQGQPGVRYAYKINSTNVHFDVPRGSK